MPPSIDAESVQPPGDGLGNATAEAMPERTPAQAAKDVYGRIHRMPGLRDDAREWVLRDAARRFPLDGAGMFTASDPEIRKWLLEMGEEVSGEVRRFRHNAVVDWVIAQNRLHGWNLIVPDKVLRIPLPKPPITGRNFPDIARFRGIRERLHAYLEAPREAGLRHLCAPVKDAECKNSLLGVILLSAIAHGGVLSIQDLVELANHEMYGAWRDDEFLLWVEWPSNGVGGYRRWIADPVTALLCARWRQLHGAVLLDPAVPVNRSSKTIWAKVRLALQVVQLDDEERPRSLQRLLEWARAWYWVEVPPFLVEFASGKLPSASLPPTAWMRLVTGRPVRPQGSSTVTSEAIAASVAVPRARNGVQIDLRAALLGPAARQPGFRTSLVNLDRFLARPDIGALYRRLALWCKHMLGAYSAVPADRRANSVRVYLQTIDSRLLQYIGNVDPADLDVEQRAVAFDAMLEGTATELTRSRVAWTLASFERFIDPQSPLARELQKAAGEAQGSTQVDANFFSTEFLTAARSAVGPDQNAHDNQNASLREVALVLGVRAKLRRIEAWRLRLRDLSGRARPELLVRPHRGERLKSSAGTRRVPLYATATAEELDLLVRHVDKQARRAHGRKDTSGEDENERSTPPVDSGGVAVFARPGTAGRPMAESALFDPITSALQWVSGDDAARYQHLRHSGLNRDHLLLMSANLPGCERILGEDYVVLSTATAAVQSALVGGPGPTKSALWAIAAEAGHASPETTCGSYLHLLDWLLYCAVTPLGPTLTASAVSAVFAASPAAARKWKERAGGSDRWLDIVTRSNSDIVKAIHPPIDVVDIGNRKPPAASQLSATRIVDVLVAAGRPDISQIKQLRPFSRTVESLLADAQRYPPSSETIAKRMAERLTGMDAAERAAIVSAIYNPSRWADAADSIDLMIDPAALSNLRDNALTLNRIRGTSTNAAWHAELELKGFDLYGGARSGVLTVVRPLPYPIRTISPVHERRAIDAWYAALLGVSRTGDPIQVDEAIAVLLARYDHGEHWWSFNTPEEAAVTLGFLRKLVMAIVDGALSASPTLHIEYVAHKKGVRSSRPGWFPTSLEAQRGVWIDALGCTTDELHVVQARPLEARSSDHGLLRVMILSSSEGAAAGATRGAKQRSAAAYWACYVYCLGRNWIME